MCFPSLSQPFGCRNVGQNHLSHFRNVIDHFWLRGLRCSKSFLQFLFVLNSCWVHSSNLEERVLKSSNKSLLKDSEVSDIKLLCYLPFLPISFTLAGCCSQTCFSKHCTHTHTFSVKSISINFIISVIWLMASLLSTAG